jgi:hypothetical protein
VDGGQNVRPESLEEQRRKSVAKLLSRRTEAMRDGLQLSETITGDGAPSLVTPAVWAWKASSRSAPARGT